MKHRTTARLIIAAIFLVCILIASAPPSRGQTPPPNTPPPQGLGSAILHEHDDTTGPERPTRDGTFNPIDTKTDKIRNRNAKEEMIVIDAAAREKEKELAKKKPHDPTFEGSIMDIAVDYIKTGKPKAEATVAPELSPIPSATPNALPTPLPSMNPSPSNGSSLPLELVPIPKRSEAPDKEAGPSPTATPHN